MILVCVLCLQMYPLIQTHVWAKIGGEHGLLKMVLDSFIKVCVCVGRGEKVGGRWGLGR